MSTLNTFSLNLLRFESNCCYWLIIFRCSLVNRVMCIEHSEFSLYDTCFKIGGVPSLVASEHFLRFFVVVGIHLKFALCADTIRIRDIRNAKAREKWVDQRAKDLLICLNFLMLQRNVGVPVSAFIFQ